MRRHVTPTVRPIICPLLHSVILNRNSLCHMLYLLSSGKLTQFIGLSSFFSSFWLMLVHFISCCCLNWLLVLLSVGRAVVDLVNTHVDASVCSLFGLFRQFIFFFSVRGSRLQHWSGLLCYCGGSVFVLPFREAFHLLPAVSTY